MEAKPEAKPESKPEEKPEAKPEDTGVKPAPRESAAANAPTQSTPVMDVVPPPIADKSDKPSENPAQPPASLVDPASLKPKHDEHVEAPAAPKKKSGTGPAIVATVIIVIALAAMAVFAYIQTAK